MINIWPGWPEPGQLSYAYLTHSLYHRLDLSVGPEAEAYLRAEDLAENGGRTYSIKPPALSLWLLVFAPLIDAATPGPLNVFQIIYFGRLAAQLVPLLAFLWMFGRFLERLAGPAAGWGSLLLMLFGTAFLSYGGYLYAHALSAALLGCALALVFGEADAPIGPVRGAGAAFCASLAATGDWCAVPAAGVVMAAALLSGYRRAKGAVPRTWAGLAAAAGAAGPAALLGAYQSLCFGGPWAASYLKGPSVWQNGPGVAGLLSEFSPDSLWQVTFGSWRGVFFYSPWVAVGTAAAIHALFSGSRKDGRLKAVVLTGLAAFAAQIVFLAFYRNRAGGFSFGLRYLLPSLPLITAAAAAALASVPTRARRAYLFALAGTGLCAAGVHALATPVFPFFPVVHPVKVNTLQAFVLPTLREGRSALTLTDLAGWSGAVGAAVPWAAAAAAFGAFTLICARRGLVGAGRAWTAAACAPVAALLLWAGLSEAGVHRTRQSETRRIIAARMLVGPGERDAAAEGFIKMIFPGPSDTQERQRYRMWPTADRRPAEDGPRV
jgi:hypothetical protein